MKMLRKSCCVTEKKSYGYDGIAPWVSPEGNIYVLLNGYRDQLVDSFYAYQVGKQSIQEITGGINSESRTAFGDSKLFFTRLVDHQMRDDYNIYVYDIFRAICPVSMCFLIPNPKTEKRINLFFHCIILEIEK